MWACALVSFSGVLSLLSFLYSPSGVPSLMLDLCPCQGVFLLSGLRGWCSISTSSSSSVLSSDTRFWVQLLPKTLLISITTLLSSALRFLLGGFLDHALPHLSHLFLHLSSGFDHPCPFSMSALMSGLYLPLNHQHLPQGLAIGLILCK